MIYDVKYFWNKFSAIPEHLWISYSQGAVETKGTAPHCALGWCKNTDGKYGDANYDKQSSCYSEEGTALIKMLAPLSKETEFIGGYLTNINNGDHPNYTQPTQKQRILAALRDIHAIDFLKNVDMRGMKFLRAHDFMKSKSGKTVYKADFKCHCGKEFAARLEHIKSGNTKSCGCAQKQLHKKQFTKHGMAGHPIYQTWHAMKSRCYNAKNIHFKHYGGRGITICDEWLNDFNSFLIWATGDGNWMAGLTIDRINVNGNYNPDNCRWATSMQQGMNKRNTIFIEHKGERLTISQWDARLGSRIVDNRLRAGWANERAVTTPVKRKSKTVYVTVDASVRELQKAELSQQ